MLEFAATDDDAPPAVDALRFGARPKHSLRAESLRKGTATEGLQACVGPVPNCEDGHTGTND